MKLLTSLFALVLPIAAQELPQATAEHHKLAESVGAWDAAIVMAGEDGQPTKSTGTSVRRQPLGEFWVIDIFQAQIMGQAFRGQGTTGYDPLKKKYVATWIDSMSPSVMVLEGNYDKTGKILTLEGLGMGPEGKPVMHRMTTTTKDKNTELFDMSILGADGKFVTAMTITYTRRVKVVDSVPGAGGGDIPQAPKEKGPIKRSPVKKDAEK